MRRIRRLFAFFLILCLTLTACAPKQPQAGASFEQMKYTRPDVDAIHTTLDEALEAADAGDEQVLELYQQLMDQLLQFDDNYALATIRNYLDLDDTYYEDEVAWLDEQYTILDNRMLELTGRILGSSCGPAAREAWGEDFIARYESNAQLNAPEIEALTVQEQQLVNQYNKLAIQEDGREQLYEDYIEGDITLKQYMEGYTEISQQRNQELGDIYMQLVQLRVQIAQTLGFSRYTDYAYQCFFRDFTPEEAAQFAQSVQEHLVPLYQELEAEYTLRIMSIEERLEASWEDGVPTLRSTLPNGYPEKMLEALDFMEERKLYDFGGGDSKMVSAFTSYISGQNAPYLFVNTAVYQDPTTIFHEFGHYYNFYLSQPALWNDGNNLDIAEVHSQGLEVLMHEAYDQLYGKDADLMRLASLKDLLYAVLSGCSEDKFQQWVYENPDATLDELNAVHAELDTQFGMDEMYYEWVEIPHHFESPFYYISYATSAISALEIWETAQQDRDHALEIYDQITQFTNNAQYREPLEQCGLSDPFDSNCVEEIAEVLADYADIDLEQLQAA